MFTCWLFCRFFSDHGRECHAPRTHARECSIPTFPNLSSNDKSSAAKHRGSFPRTFGPRPPRAFGLLARATAHPDLNRNRLMSVEPAPYGLPCTRSGPKNVVYFFANRLDDWPSPNSPTRTPRCCDDRARLVADKLANGKEPAKENRPSRVGSVAARGRGPARPTATRSRSSFPISYTSYAHRLESRLYGLSMRSTLKNPQLMPSDATLGQWATGRDTARQPPTSEATPPSPAASASCWSIPHTTWKW